MPSRSCYDRFVGFMSCYFMLDHVRSGYVMLVKDSLGKFRFGHVRID